ncbi:MAG: hypothetical protein WEA29_01465 [Acidimicrobiia bacterium]
MSRQRGRREPPKPEKEAYVESLKKSRRERARERAEASGRPGVASIITPRRRWAAVAFATFFIVFAFASLLNAIIESDAGNDAGARLAMIFAAMLSLFSIGVLAIVSRVDRPMRAIFLGGPAAIAIFMVLGAVLREPATPLVAAYGAVGIFALRPAPGGSTRTRSLYVITATAVVGFGYIVAPAVAATVAPLIPYFLLHFADVVSNRRSGVEMMETIKAREEPEGEPDDWAEEG